MALILAFVLIPNELNASDETKVEDEEDEILDENDEEDVLEDLQMSKRQIGWGQVLGNRHAFFALAVCFFGTWAIIDYTGFIATEMVDVYGTAED